MIGSPKLHEYQRQRAEIKAQIAALLKQEEDRPADESTPEAEASQIDQLLVQLAEIEGRITRLEAMLATDANGDGDAGGDEETGFRPVVANAGGMTGGGFRIPAQARRAPVEGKGFQVARFMVGLAWVKWYGLEKAQEAHFNRFGDGVVAKALNIGVVAEGGALIPQDFMLDYIELLRSATVMRAAGPMMVGMPLGNMTIPRMAGGSTAVYQGEMDDMSVTEPLFDDLNLVAKKLTAMVPVSNDLLRRSPIGVETIIRDDLIATSAHREDLAFIRGDGSNQTPTGWRSLVLPANLIVVPAGGTLDIVVATLAAMKMALVQGMSRMIKPVWVSSAPLFEFIATRRDLQGGFYFKDEIGRGMLEGFPIYYTQQIPTNLGAGNGTELYLADMADTVLADTMAVQVDASDVAAYYGTDGKVVSTFQRDQSLFRVISEHDFNMRHLQSLAVAVPSDWFFAGLPPTAGRPWSTQPLNPHWARAPAAWPAAVAHDAAPTIYDPAVVGTSAFAGTLTANPGGGPYPLVGAAMAPPEGDGTTRAADPGPGPGPGSPGPATNGNQRTGRTPPKE